ncbi:MAG TPA: O-antigen ligase family protein [Gemmatimonadaceae bacterium]|nr:O-antigen ligase family protein [Gemmatimonadaceae bacterium]
MTHSLWLRSAYGEPRRAPAMPAAAAAPAYVAVNPVLRLTLYLFVFSIPFEMPRYAIPLEVPTLTASLFLATTLLNPSAAFRRMPRAVLWFGLYLWVYVAAWVFLANEHGTETMRQFLFMVLLIAVLWVVYNLLADPRVLRGVLLAVVISCVVRAGMQWFGIAATAMDVWTGGQRVTVLGQNPNLSAIILSVGLVTVLGLQATRARWLPRFELLSWPLAAAIGFAIIQSGSRGGLLCAAAGMLVFFLHGRTFWRRLMNAAVGTVAVALLAWGALQSEMMRGRLVESAEAGRYAGRELIYPTAIQMFSERPLLGWGPIDNQYEIARRIERVQQQKNPSRDAHNLVLELITTTGVVGALPFFIGIALCVRGAWRARWGPLGMLPLAVLVAVLAGTVTGTWIASKVLWFALALALAAGDHWSAPVSRPEGVR